MKVCSVKAAWEAADAMFSTDYIYDGWRSERAGYAVYVSTLKGCDDYICDLGDRLEVNIGADSVNIWIDEPQFKEYQIADALEVIDDVIYDIDDKVDWKLAEAVGIRDARDQIYAAYAKLKALLDAGYPDSKLYRQYNLQDC